MSEKILTTVLALVLLALVVVTVIALLQFALIVGMSFDAMDVALRGGL